MFFKKLFSKIADFLKRLFSPIVFDLEEEYADVLEKASEISNRNVLVGTVRRREQISVNLEKNFYHIPINQLMVSEGIEYVALYQSKTLFDKDTDLNGVVWYARVIESKKVKRRDIKEIHSTSGEDYMRFEVDKWAQITNPIEIREKYPKVFLKTSFYLLSRAKYTCELYFTSAESYIIYLGMTDIANDLYDGFTFRDITVIKRFSKYVIKKNDQKYTIKLKHFLREPHGKISEFLHFFDYYS